jgi:hypothetical protein
MHVAAVECVEQMRQPVGIRSVAVCRKSKIARRDWRQDRYARALRDLPDGASNHGKGIVWRDSKPDRRTAAKTAPGAENQYAKRKTTTEQCVQVSEKSSKINNSANPQQAEYASHVENDAWSCCAGQKVGILIVEPASSGECRMIYVQTPYAVIGKGGTSCSGVIF